MLLPVFAAGTNGEVARPQGVTEGYFCAIAPEWPKISPVTASPGKPMKWPSCADALLS